MITKDDLKFAQDGKFSEFKNVINKELMNKLNNHSTIQTYKSKLNDYDNLKNQFAEINSTEGE